MRRQYNYTKILIICMSIIYCENSMAQKLAQDNEGYSNLIIPSTLLSLDVVNKVGTFELINRQNNGKKNYLMYGIQLQGAIENDAGLLFSGGKVASNSSIRFMVGNLIERKDSEELFDERVDLKLEEIEKVDKEIGNLKKEFDSMIKKASSNSLITALQAKAKEFTSPYQSINVTTTQNSLKNIHENQLLNFEENKEELAEAAKFYKQLKQLFEKILPEIVKMEKLELDYKVLVNRGFRNSSDFFFFRAGFNGSSFKYESAPNATTLSERFIDESFNGWNAEIGYNYNRGLSYTGFSLIASRMSNISGLEENTYTLKVQDDVITEGEFSTTRSIGALSGDYEVFNRLSLTLDYAQIFQVDESADLYVSAYFFARQRFYTNTSILNDNMVTGIGLNALNSAQGSLLGGIYIQTNDLFGVNSKDSTLGQRIVFGIIAKASFRSTSLRERK